MNRVLFVGYILIFLYYVAIYIHIFFYLKVWVNILSEWWTISMCIFKYGTFKVEPFLKKNIDNFTLF